MTQRLDLFAASAPMMQSLIEWSTAMQGQLLEMPLMELVKIRASQLNGCAMCLHMHSNAALKAGETQERLNVLPAWRESPLFSDREKAALAWTDALTLSPQTGASDEVYAMVKAQFSDEEQMKLTMMIGIINIWNRFGVGFRVPHQTQERRQAA